MVGSTAEIVRPVRSARLRDTRVSLRSEFTPMVTSTRPRYIVTIKGSTIANSTAATPFVEHRSSAARSRRRRPPLTAEEVIAAIIGTSSSERFVAERGRGHDQALAIGEV